MSFWVAQNLISALIVTFNCHITCQSRYRILEKGDLTDCQRQFPVGGPGWARAPSIRKFSKLKSSEMGFPALRPSQRVIMSKSFFFNLGGLMKFPERPTYNPALPSNLMAKKKKHL